MSIKPVVKHVKEYNERFCDLCGRFKHGRFVEFRDFMICGGCCRVMNEAIELDDSDKEL